MYRRDGTTAIVLHGIVLFLGSRPVEVVDSVAEKGVLEPLVVTDDDKIISGHRRWLAAKAAGEVGVPVRRVDFDTDLAEREALIEFNRQREKTPGQLVNEFEEMLAIEKRRAAKRRQAAQNNDTADEIAESETFPEQGGEARDKAAEKVNADVSGRTLEKGKKVKDKAESDIVLGAQRIGSVLPNIGRRKRALFLVRL